MPSMRICDRRSLCAAPCTPYLHRKESRLLCVCPPDFYRRPPTLVVRQPNFSPFSDALSSLRRFQRVNRCRRKESRRRGLLLARTRRTASHRRAGAGTRPRRGRRACLGKLHSATASASPRVGRSMGVFALNGFSVFSFSNRRLMSSSFHRSPCLLARVFRGRPRLACRRAAASVDASPAFA